MRIVFCGSGDFGLPTLRHLVREGMDIAAVYTQPPRPAGRGGKIRPTPVAAACEELNLPVAPVEDINAPACVSALADLGADVIVVADFGQMIRAPARRTARHEAINLHGSLLPALRGAAPVNWAIIRGCGETGVTTFRLVDAMDAGPVFVRKALAIDPSDTAGDLRQKLSELGVAAVAETLGMLAAGLTDGAEQDHDRATLAPLLKKSDGRIDFTADAVAVRNRVHGTWPWPGGQARYVAADGKAVDVVLARVRVADGPDAGEPGSIGRDLSVATGRGRLQIIEIRPAGKRLMAWRDFANGHRAGPGARFTSPAP